MKLSLCLLIIFLFDLNQISVGTIMDCIRSPYSKVCFLNSNYIPTNNPKPVPTQIDVILHIDDIIDINEAEQTVTLLMRITLEWIDKRLDVKKLPYSPGNDSWFLIDLNDMNQLWTPAVYFGNAKDIKKSGSFGKDLLAYLWYKSDNHLLHYSEIFMVTFSCGLNFEPFPFDSHECNLDLKNWIGTESQAGCPDVAF